VLWVRTRPFGWAAANAEQRQHLYRFTDYGWTLPAGFCSHHGFNVTTLPPVPRLTLLADGRGCVRYCPHPRVRFQPGVPHLHHGCVISPSLPTVVDDVGEQRTVTRYHACLHHMQHAVVPPFTVAALLPPRDGRHHLYHIVYYRFATFVRHHFSSLRTTTRPPPLR